MGVPFTKMQGAGNDYVYLDAFDADVRSFLAGIDPAALARRVSHRNFGVGSDGLIVLAPPSGPGSDATMLMWNADGSRGAMCGNGLRCLAKLAREHARVARDSFVVATDAGLRRTSVVRCAEGTIVAARVEIGAVEVAPRPLRIEHAGRSFDLHLANAGNPHAVVFVPDVDTAPVVELGAHLQTHASFRGGVNVEFVTLRTDGALVQRTYERGSGETLACGTGAAAVASVALRLRLASGPRVKVVLRGGEVTLEVAGAGGELVLEGPAVTVFTGELPLL